MSLESLYLCELVFVPLMGILKSCPLLVFALPQSSQLPIIELNLPLLPLDYHLQILIFYLKLLDLFFVLLALARSLNPLLGHRLRGLLVHYDRLPKQQGLRIVVLRHVLHFDDHLLL